MERYVYAIPSYKRADEQGTLEYLSSLGVPKDLIWIFVQTAEDKDAYERYSDRANIVYRPAAGVAAARNNVLRELSAIHNIVMMDDDVSRILQMRQDKLVPIETREGLADLLNICFGKAARAGAEMWGMYPVDNAYFMSYTISTAVTVNTVIGFAAGTRKRFDTSFKAKEDIELCGRTLSSGEKVYRYNFLAYTAKHRTNKGGCYDVWKSNENRRTVERLCQMYPTIFAPKGNNPSEVRVLLKDNKISIRGR